MITPDPDDKKKVNSVSPNLPTSTTIEEQIDAIAERVKQLVTIAHNDGKNNIVYFPQPQDYAAHEIKAAILSIVEQAEREARPLEMMIRWLAENQFGSEREEEALIILDTALEMLSEFLPPLTTHQSLTRKADELSTRGNQVDTSVMSQAKSYSEAQLNQAVIAGRIEELEAILGHWHHGSHPEPKVSVALAEKRLAKLKEKK